MDEEVTHLRPSALRGGRFGRSAGLRDAKRRRGVGRRLLVLKLWLVAGLVALGGALYLRLDSAPLEIAGLSERVAAAVEDRLGAAWRVSLADSALTLHEGSPALAVDGLDLTDRDGARIAHAPRAIVSVGALSLLTGAPVPRAVVLSDVELRVLVAEDGTVSLLPPDGGEPVAAPIRPAGESPASDLPAVGPVAAVAGALAGILDEASPLGGLSRARLENARLTLVGADGRERVGFARVDARVRRDGAMRRIEATFDGPGGAWSVEGSVGREPDGGRAARLAVEAMPVRDLTLVTGLSDALGSRDLTLTGEAAIAIGPDGDLRRFSARLESNSGWLRTRDPFMPLVPVERLAAEATWLPGEKRLALRNVEIAGGRTRVTLAGALVPEGSDGRWRLALAGGDAVVRGATDAEPTLALSRVSVAARGGSDGVVVEELSLAGPGVDLALMASFGGAEDRGGLRVALDAVDLPVRAALALWPDFVAPIPRLFLRRALTRGTVTDLDVAVALTGEDLAGLFEKQPLPPEAIDVRFAMEGVRLVLDEDFPPLRDAVVSGTVTGEDAFVDATSAHVLTADGRRLDASDGRFRLENYWESTSPARIAFSATGGLDALAAFLRTPALSGAADLALDPDAVAGDVALDVAFSFPIGEPVEVARLPIAATGRLENVSAPLVGDAERLEDGSLALGFDPDGTLRLDGTGTIAGSPVTVALVDPRGSPGEARVSGSVDAGLLAARGLVPQGAASGPVALEVEARLGPGDALSATIAADLAGARLDGLLPGWTKAAGAPGTLAVSLATDPEGIVFRDLALESGPVVLRGGGRVGPDGALRSLDLATARLSRGDDAALTVSRTEGGAWAARLTGSVFDLRPIMTHLRDDGGGGDDGAAALDARLDARVDILGGFGGEVLTNVAAGLRVVDGAVRDGTIDARYPGGPLTARIVDGRLAVETADAGATLRFLDLYDRMIGGRLALQVGLDGARAPGQLILWDFVLRDEPALRSVVGRQLPASAGSDARFGLSGPAVDASEALFTKAQVDFIRDGSVLTLADARMWGPQLGFTLEGWVDLEAQRLDIAGSYVPAYGLNNAFAQVPVFGTILGGSQYEGLFAVNFRVAGPVSDPALTINPLSAIAPGVLRRLFGAGAPTRRGPALEAPPPAPPLDITPG
ncbi:AsmA-like C-terminal region-containing protein [Salinarimonas rosea]|uniref:AsmA-like C-terminal region-containing protein n=1 Tax=Salinarimonas rosea TaxID=552063 RepID=UPI00041306D7|nr:AsmA-like C-terminal region-containing protein [Salinarimonas rosea]